MRWEALTSAELDAIDRDTPVVLSIAAIEQHGPHLPLSTDATIGQGFLADLDAAVGRDVLILPQVAIGCSEHHMDFPGSLTVRHRVFIDYVCDIVGSVFRHGFRTVVLLNSHGGNQAAGQVAIEELGGAWPDRQVALLTWWRLAAPDLAPLRESTRGGASHAGEFETSLMLHLAPDSVRGDLTPKGRPRNDPAPDWAQDDMLMGNRGLLHRTMRTKSGGNGVVGDAELGTGDKGKAAMVLSSSGNAGPTSACCRLADELARSRGWVNLTTTFHNPYGIDAYATIAYELAACAPDVLLLPISSGPLLAALMKGFARLRDAGEITAIPRPIAVQPSGCAPIARAFDAGGAIEPWAHGTTVASALNDTLAGYGRDGDDTLRHIRAHGGAAIAIDDAQILEGVRQAARLEGTVLEPSAAITLAAIGPLRARHYLARRQGRGCRDRTRPEGPQPRTHRRRRGHPTRYRRADSQPLTLGHGAPTAARRAARSAIVTDRPGTSTLGPRLRPRDSRRALRDSGGRPSLPWPDLLGQPSRSAAAIAASPSR